MVMCHWVQNRIPAYLSGELGAKEAKWLVWHLQQCHACQKALRMLKGMSDTVAKAIATEMRAPATMSARVMAAIDTMPKPDAPPRKPPRFRPWRR